MPSYTTRKDYFFLVYLKLTCKTNKMLMNYDNTQYKFHILKSFSNSDSECEGQIKQIFTDINYWVQEKKIRLSCI